MADDRPTTRGERKATGEVNPLPKEERDSLAESVGITEWGARAETLERLLSSCGYRQGLDSEPRPDEFLFERTDSSGFRGFIPRGHVGFIAGRGGTGKSTLALQAAISVATGRPWFGGELKDGQKTIVRPTADVAGCLAYVCFAEESADDTAKRIIRITKAMNLNESEKTTLLSNLILKPMRGLPTLLMAENDDERRTNLYREIVGELRYEIWLRTIPATQAYKLDDGTIIKAKAAVPPAFGLLIFDPIARFGRDFEKDSTEATEIVALFETLTSKNFGKPTVILVHHATKGDEDNPEAALSHGNARGSSAIADAARFVIMVAGARVESESGVETLSMMQLSKSNYTALDFPTMHLKRDGFAYRQATGLEVQNYKAARKSRDDESKNTKNTVKKIIGGRNFDPHAD